MIVVSDTSPLNYLILIGSTEILPRIFGQLIDEKAGRKAARERGLQVVGTLGVLNRAAHLELIDLPHSIEQLKATNVHVQEVLIEDMLREDRERKLAQEQKRKHGPTLEP